LEYFFYKKKNIQKGFTWASETPQLRVSVSLLESSTLPFGI